MHPKTTTVRAFGLVLSLALLPLILGGCFAMQKDLDPVRSDISVIERQFMELQREQARLRVKIDEMRPGAGDETAARLDRLEDRLDALERASGGSRIPGGAGTMAPQPMAPEPMGAEPVMIEPIPETESQPPVLVTPGTAPTMPPRATMAAEELYAQAMASYKGGDTMMAEAGFRDILEQYPDNRLADNAAYWLGEIQFNNKEFDKAIESFRRVVSDYPVGDKVPDAVFMLGRSYEEKGQPDKARESYNRVMDNYPYSDAARNARQRMNGIY